jgi:NDP-sugar pyrophosphorylase family protein
VPVGGRPFLDRQIEWVRALGVERIHLALGYRADLIAHWVHRAYPGDLSITTSVEPRPLGTGGGLKFVDAMVPGEALLVLNGDSLLPGLDCCKLESAISNPACVLAMAVVWIEQTGRYGTVKLEDDNRVASFHEKDSVPCRESPGQLTVTPSVRTTPARSAQLRR